MEKIEKEFTKIPGWLGGVIILGVVVWVLYLITVRYERSPYFERTNNPAYRIENNLRIFANAADQYILENDLEGKEFEITLKDLTGPNGYFKSLESYFGEDYSTIKITQNTEQISVETEDGVVVRYEFK